MRILRLLAFSIILLLLTLSVLNLYQIFISKRVIKNEASIDTSILQVKEDIELTKKKQNENIDLLKQTIKARENDLDILNKALTEYTSI